MNAKLPEIIQSQGQVEILPRCRMRTVPVLWGPNLCDNTVQDGWNKTHNCCLIPSQKPFGRYMRMPKFQCNTYSGLKHSALKKNLASHFRCWNRTVFFFAFFFGLPKKCTRGSPPPVLSIICTVGLFLHPAAKQRLATPHQVLSPGATGLATQKQNLECSFLSPGFASNASCIPSLKAQLMLSNPR